VDHSEGGMLALGADAPPDDPVLVILDTDWGQFHDLETEAPGPVETSVQVEFPRVPLYVSPWLRPSFSGGASAGKRVAVDIDGPKGRLWHMQVPTYVGARVPNVIGIGTPLPGVDEFAFEYDHHALAKGTHTVTVSADVRRRRARGAARSARARRRRCRCDLRGHRGRRHGRPHRSPNGPAGAPHGPPQRSYARSRLAGSSC